MLEVRDFSAGYGKTTIVDGVSLSFEAGRLTAMLGRNGVGKTTLLRAMFGLCDVFSGSVVANGSPVPRGRPEALARAGFSFMPDDRGVFPSLTVAENLELARRKGYRPAVDVTELFPLLTDRSDQPAGQLSGGQKQQVGIARAILAGQHLIAIDEFTQGLQPSLAQSALEALRVVASQGTAVVFVEQSPKLPLKYADRVVGMLKGKVVFDRLTVDVAEDSAELNDLLVVS